LQQKDERNLTDLWQGILKRADLPEGTVPLWFSTCAPVSIEEGELVVDTANPFIKEQIAKKFLARLNEAAEGMGVRGLRLQASVQPEEARAEPARQERQEGPGRSAPAARISLNPNYTFESFVVGKSNRLAQASSLAVAESLVSTEAPVKERFNPLFIWGGVGLGKTHLMHAICHYALKRSPDLRALYISAEKFLNEFIQSIRDSKTDQFKDRYRNVDILLIDDIQFLGNRERSQEEFFHTFNTLYEGNSQVVICSDRQPSELQNIEDRLISRFNWGMVADIQPPDLETRIAILQKKAMLRGCDLPDEVVHFLAQHIPSNIRDLEGALNRVIMSSELYGEPVTIERSSEWLKDVLRMDVKAPVTVEDIQSVVAEYFSMSPEELTSSKRTAELAMARQIAMFLCCEMTETSLLRIAHAFRKKDHTTVIHARKKISELVKTDQEVRRAVDNLKNRL